MKIMGKILHKLKGLLYGIPFGMKGADEILTATNTDPDNGTSVEQKQEQKSVLNDLLKGELTQEVEELRYETFKAEEMSNEYTYIGSGQAVKKNGESGLKRRKFVQYNAHQEYSVQESMEMLKSENKAKWDDWKDRNVFKATYKNPFVKFKLENYVEKVRVELNKDSYKTYMYFIDDYYCRKTKPLVNFAKKTKKEFEALQNEENKKKILSYLEKNELCNELESWSFTTINATNDVPNGIDYNFKSPKLEEIQEEDGYVVLVYSWKNFDGNVLLSEKFKSESAEKKFENKEKREGYVPNAMDLAKTDEPTEIRNREKDNLEDWLDENENEISLKIE